MSKGSGNTRASSSLSPNGVAINSARLSGDIPAGIRVKFAEVIDPGDATFEGVVLEDRTNTLLVKDVDSNWTRVIDKQDLVRTGIDANDEQKIQRFTVGANDYQRIVFANGVELEVKSSSGTTNGTLSVIPINNGKRGKEEYKVDWGYGLPISHNFAETIIKDYLRRRSR